MVETRTAAAAAILLALAGGPFLAACDDRPEQSERKADNPGERTVGQAPPPDAPPRKTEQAQSRPPENVKPGAGPQTPPGAAATLIGTWRVRVKSGADEAQPGITYTFTADGRVTVGPDQVCRYKIENQTLSIDCAGTSAESARGPLERQDQDHLVWKVGDKTVRLDRQAGLKEQQ